MVTYQNFQDWEPKLEFEQQVTAEELQSCEDYKAKLAADMKRLGLKP